MNISPLPRTLKSGGKGKAIYNNIEKQKIAFATLNRLVHIKRAKAILTNIYLIVK